MKKFKTRPLTFIVLTLFLFGTIFGSSTVAFAVDGETVSLHEPHVGASSEHFTTSSDNGGLTDPVVWHFVLNQADEATGPVTLTANFQTAGTITVTGSPTGQNKVQHFYIGTQTHDILLGATAFTGTGKLLLSHVSINDAGNEEPVYNITLDKSVNPTTAVRGDEVTYRFVITNTGNQTIEKFTLSDPLLGINLPIVYSLQGGNSYTTEAAFNIPDDQEGSVLENTATVTVDEHELIASDSAIVTLTTENEDPKYGLEFEKLVNVSSANPGDTVNYTFTVRNTGTDKLDNVALTDSKMGPEWKIIFNLEANETFTTTVALTIPNGFQGEEFENIATVEVEDHELIATDSAIVTISTTPPVDPRYSITLDKSVNVSSASPGDTITYTFVVKNIGNHDLTEVIVTDPMFDGEGAWNENIGTLTAGAIYTFTHNYKIPGDKVFPFTNIARVESHQEVWDEDTATVTRYSTTGGGEGDTGGGGNTTTIQEEQVPAGPIEIENTNDEVIILDQEIPLGPVLPKTDGVSPMLFYGVGAFITAMGARLRRSK